MSVTSPPRRPEIENDRDLEQRVADLEALIEEARRRARRRRQRHGAAALLIAAGVAALIGFGSHGGGAGTAATASAHGSQGSTAKADSPPLAALPPNAGTADTFAFDPRNPQIVYVLTTSVGALTRGHVFELTRGHVFKTTDGGAHWQATATNGSGWVGDTETLTADPRHPGTLYAGTTVAVYKTVDGGRSWRPFNQGLFPPRGQQVCYRPAGARPYCVKQPFGTAGTPHFNRGNGWVTAIAVDPANTNIVYSGADAVRKSTDGGHSWKTVLRFDPAGYRWLSNVSALAIAPTRPKSIYAIENAFNGHTTHTWIFKSSDAGKTWRATGGGAKVFTNRDGWGGALAVDPQHPTTVYASIGRTLLRTTDAGASWQPITQGLPPQVVTALTVDPKQPETVYAGLSSTYKGRVISAMGGIYKTTNGGDTWTQALSGITAGTLAVDPARPTTIYAAVHARQERVARSTNAGRTWATAP
jgi:photosystem II stability/assembly factor-like uncharacterized protein